MDQSSSSSEFIQLDNLDYEYYNSQGQQKEESKNLLKKYENDNEYKEHSDYIRGLTRNEHKYWIDALRICSNYMVIAVHASYVLYYDIEVLTPNWYGLVFWDTLNRPCVNLFVMISGLLFLDPEKEIPISKLYKKYVFRIFKTLYFWSFFYALVVKHVLNPFNVTYESKKQFFHKLLFSTVLGKYHLWYLFMCIGLYMMTPILRPIVKNKKAMEYALILGIIVGYIVPFVSLIIQNYCSETFFEYYDLIPHVINRFRIFHPYNYIVYYVLGYYLNQIEIKNKITLYIIYAVGVVDVIFIHLIKLDISQKTGEEFKKITDNNSFTLLIYTVAMFIFFKHTVNEKIKLFIHNNKFKTILRKLSSLSYGSYLVHIVYFEVLYCLGYFKLTVNHTYLFTPINAMLVFLLTVATVYLLKKIPIIRSFI